MTILEEHLVLLRERRISLLNQIEALHDGDRKASLRVLLAAIDSQIAALQASGEVSSRFMVQARF